MSEGYKYIYDEAELEVVTRVRSEVQQLCFARELPSNFTVTAEHGGNVYVAMGYFPEDLEVNPVDVFAPFVEYWKDLHWSWSFELHFGDYVLDVHAAEPQIGLLKKVTVEEQYTFFEGLEDVREVLEGGRNA